MKLNLINILFTICACLIGKQENIWSKFEFLGKDSCIEFLDTASQLILDSDLNNFNGTLKLPNSLIENYIKNLQNYSIDFAGGKLVFGNDMESQTLSGRLDSKASLRTNSNTKLAMTGKQALNFNNTHVTSSLTISGLDNTVSGTPIFDNKITLSDKNSELKLDIKTKLSQNIILNGGTITLLSDIQLKDFVTFEGDGIVDINGYSLILPTNSSTLKLGVIFLNANDIQLNGYTTLSGTWTFTGENSSSTINGYGNVLDMTNGSITVGPGHTLYATGVNFKGLGYSAGIFNLSDTSIMKLSSSSLEIVDDYVLSHGLITVEGPYCKLIVKDKHYFVITGPSGVLQIDGAVLNYETLGNAPIFPTPIVALYGGVLDFVNGGTTFNPKMPTLEGMIELSFPSSQSINYLNFSAICGPFTKIHFLNEDYSVPKEIVVDATDKMLSFTSAEQGCINIDPNITFLIRNVLLQDFSLSLFTLSGTSTSKAKVWYGDNAIISLNKDMTLQAEQLTVVGNVTINGNNKIINAMGTGNILVNDNQSLTIIDSTLNLTCSDSIIMGSGSSLVLDNVLIKLGAAGWLFDSGSIECHNYVEVATSKEYDDPCYFRYLTSGNFLVKSKSKLHFTDGIEFYYVPTPTSALESTESLNRHFSLEDKSSYLYLSDCIIDLVEHGITLDYGNLVINNNVEFEMDSTNTVALELGSSLCLTINPGANLCINGPVIYGSS